MTYVTMSRSNRSVTTCPAGRRAKRWSSPSGTGASDGAMHGERLANGEHVVHAQDRRAAIDGREARGDRAAEPFTGRRVGRCDLGDEGLAARADDDRRAEGGEFAETRDELDRVRGVFHVADPRIEKDVAPSETFS